MIRNNNQNGRRRGRGGARPPQGGGPSGNYGNTSGGGSRIDTRQRGNATQLLEKYKAMARDATQNGDRVQAEFYMQYADHYYRVLNEFRARDPQPAPRQNYDEDDGFDNMGGVGQNYATPQSGSYADDGDEDDGDDEAARRDAPAQQGGAQQGGERQNYERPAADRQNGERQNYDRNRNGANSPQQQRAYNGQREGQQRDGGQRDGQQRDGYQRDSQQRDGQQRDGQQRDGQPRANANRDAEPRAYRDDGRLDGGRNDNGRGGESRGDARPETRSEAGNDSRPVERAPRESYRRAPEPVAETSMMIAGLPGPATIAAEAAPAPVMDGVPPADVLADAGEPVRRPRGRPRKVVVPAADAADA